jgi:hypothetical protein
MTQKATHDPMHIRKLSTSTSPFTQIGKKKLTSLPFKRKKSWASGVNVSFPQLAEQNFDLKFIDHHFCPHSNAKSTN